MLYRGQFLYKVISGRLQIGPRIFVAGESVPLNMEQAESLYPTGQLEYVKTIRNRGTKRRHSAPGEKLEGWAMCEMARLWLNDLRTMAMKEYGIADKRLKPYEIIRYVYDTRKRIKHGI